MHLFPSSFLRTRFQALLISAFLFSRFYAQEIKFKSIGVDEGLSINFVLCILQDKNGFMWFGTQDGLNRYDGYQVTVFRNRHDDANSISNNAVNCLAEDKAGNILIGTNDGGLNIYDPLKNKFTHFVHDPKKNSLSNNTVRCILTDSDGKIWVGTEHGLNLVDPANGNVTTYFHTENETGSLPDNQVYSLAQTADGVLWIGTFDKGLCSFNKKSGQFKTFLIPPQFASGNTSLDEYKNRIYALHATSEGKIYVGTDGGMGIFNNETAQWENFVHFGNAKYENLTLLNRIWGIAEDKQGILWIASYGGGLIRYKKSGDYDVYTQNETEFYSLRSNQIVSVLVDQEDNVWAGTQSNGINVFFRALNKFQHFKHNELNPNSLNNDHVFALLVDRNGKTWIGTDGGGVNIFDKSTGKFDISFNEKLKKSGITNLSVLSLFEDSEGMIWVGTWGSGLVSYDPATGKTTDYLSTSTWGTAVTKIIESPDGNIWVATYGDGVYRINKKTGKTMRFDEENGLSSAKVFCVFLDSKKNLWIGTEGGGVCLKALAETGNEKPFKLFQHDGTNKGLSSNTIYDIYEDPSGIFWLGTTNGLNKIERDGKIVYYFEKDGLPNSTVYGIMPDKSGNLWMTTNKGVSRFNPRALATASQKPDENPRKENEVFRNYDKKDGLQGLEFNSGSFYVSKTGEMLVGGENGFNIFKPAAIADNPHAPKVYISSFKRFGKEVNFDSSIVSKKFIELSYRDNFFSFDFVALDYLEPSKNKFSYMLEGVDEHWSAPSTIRYASYTQLEGGHYVFRVKASNNDGIWNEIPTELHIRIIPPWWKTKWFYTLSILAGIAAIFGFVRYRTAAVKKENRILEQKVAERTFELAQKNKDITSSIEYAKRIQEALLPSTDLIFSRLSDAFILYKPKDIVSGDFYWFGEKNELKIFAVVDCTGHGVPGAFMSMIGHNLLNQVVLENGITDPGSILNALNKGVQAALKQGSNSVNTNDGMDVALVTLNTRNNDLKFAGANRSLVVVSKEGELEKIDSNKFPIGGAQINSERNFTTHHKMMAKGDTVYLFSDGFADQFGGDKGKKFMVKRFHELLSSIQIYPMADQGKVLNEKLESWKGTYEQVDDVLVAGIRF
jgi:ligand-binding sensor domain-containing protein/serine phosphatase RsbU (regulator of sigma subunit)